MMTQIALSAALLLSQSKTQIWDVADRWICRTEIARFCEQTDRPCRTVAGEAVFQIDFKAGEFKPIGVERRFVETIVQRVDRSQYGHVKIVLNNAEVVVFAAKPEPAENAYRFTFSRLGLNSQNHYHGLCYPE